MAWAARAPGWLSLVAGLVFALGQPPLDLWWVALPALLVPFWLMRQGPAPWAAFRQGWAFGLGYFGLSLLWIVEPFLVDAARHGWMAPFALMFMAGGLALFWGGAFGLVARWRLGGAGLVAVWTLAEMLRGWILTGFPWGLAGYVLAPLPLVHWAAWIGSIGLSAMALGLAALVVQGRRGAGAAVLLGLALWAGGLAVQAPIGDSSDRPVLRLVQPNAAQHQKWDPAFRRIHFDRLVALTAQDPRPDMVVWPETALTVFLHQAEPALDIMSTAAGGADLVFGVQRFDEGQFFNAAVRLTGQGHVAEIYDKHHLVPFGEYMPLQGLFLRYGIVGLAGAPSGFSPGPGPKLIQTVAGRALPLICYEAVFARDLRGTERPDYVLHLTNDAWFGDRGGPAQHLMQARMRAIEFGLPVARAANTGVSAMIDPGGRIIAQLQLGEEGVVDAPLPQAAPPTPYSRFGDLPVVVFCLATLILLGLRRKAV